MLLIRRFEERCAQLYVEGKIGGFLHLYIGQEAVGVGAISLLRPDDYFITSYRDHGYALARGTDPAPAAGRAVRQGHRHQPRQGRQHALLRRARAATSAGTASWAATCPWPRAWATASGCAAPTRSCLCFFGDGAVNEGAFHEALNVSALWDLPVVYIIENNRYGMGTSLDRASSVKDLYQRGSAYGIPRRDVNGMDLVAVRNVLGRGHRPRAQGEAAHPHRGRDLPLPRPLHVRPRQVPHQGRGRGDDEVRPDPAVRAGASSSRSASPRPTSTRWTRRSWPRWTTRVAFAEQSPDPPPESLYEDVYVRSPYINMKAAEKDPAWQRRRCRGATDDAGQDAARRIAARGQGREG